GRGAGGVYALSGASVRSSFSDHQPPIAMSANATRPRYAAASTDVAAFGPGWKSTTRASRTGSASVPIVAVRMPAATWRAIDLPSAVATQSHPAVAIAAQQHTSVSQPSDAQPLMPAGPNQSANS